MQILLIVCLLALSLNLSANSPNLSAPYAFFKHTKEQGLPSNSVRSIVEDRHGYIWVGTEKGLVRFDGSRFDPIVDYHKNVINNAVNCLYADTNGVWVGAENGLYFINDVTGKIDYYNIQSEPKNIPDNYIKQIHSIKGRMWVGTYNGLSQIKTAQQAAFFFADKALSQNKRSIVDIGSIDESNYLIATEAGMFVLNPIDSIYTETVLFPDSPGKPSFLVRESDSTHLVGGNLNVCRIQFKDGKLISEKIFENDGQYAFRSCLIDKSGLWLGTRGYGIKLYAYDSGHYTERTQGLPNQTVETIYKDSEGRIWAGSWQGLYLLNNLGTLVDLVNIHDFASVEGKQNGMVRRVCPVNKHHVFVLMERGFFSFSKKDGTWNGFELESKEELNSGTFIYPTSDSTLWLMGKNELIYTKINGRRATALIKISDISYVKANETENNIYAIQNSKPIMINVATGKISPIAIDFPAYSFIPLHAPGDYAIIGSKNAVLHIAGQKMQVGLYRNYGSERAPVLLQDYVLFKSGRYFMSLHLTTFKTDTFSFNDQSDVVHDFYGQLGLKKYGLISAGNKVFLAVDPQTKSIRYTKIPAGHFNIIQDQAWIANSDGIFISGKIQEEDLFEEMQFVKINKAAGLPDELMNGRVVTLNNDKHAFGMLPWSFISFETQMLKNVSEIRVRKLFVSNISFSDSTISIAQSPLFAQYIELPYHAGSVDLSFSALNFQPGNIMSYYCELSTGKHTSLIPLKGRNYYGLTNPSPGKYVLKFYGIDQWGYRYDAPHAITINVLRPFWMMWWFYLLCAIPAAGLLYLFVKWREKRLMREKAILEEKVKLRTKEILHKNEELEEQKTEIEAQNDHIIELLREIEDSIETAKVIQDSILPNPEVISTRFKNFFLYYNPKDIVSGDFYWYKETDESVYLGAFDCTGHGVAGAFMSVIGYNLLESIVAQHPAACPGTVLNLLNRGVIATLRQGEGAGSRDGMDCTLLRLNKADGIYELAGAMNPLYRVRNGEIEQIKTDKFSIGIPVLGDVKTFVTTRPDIQPGDTIALASDGYMGQLGGADGTEKLMPFRLREMLVASASMSAGEIGLFLEQNLKAWRKDTPQTDDVMVMGFQL